jgi:hypothetical protein
MRQSLVNEYVRTPETRRTCCARSCFVCGFDFASAYGEAGVSCRVYRRAAEHAVPEKLSLAEGR